MTQWVVTAFKEYSGHVVASGIVGGFHAVHAASGLSGAMIVSGNLASGQVGSYQGPAGVSGHVASGYVPMSPPWQGNVASGMSQAGGWMRRSKVIWSLKMSINGSIIEDWEQFTSGYVDEQPEGKPIQLSEWLIRKNCVMKYDSIVEAQQRAVEIRMLNIDVSMDVMVEELAA